MALTLYVRSTEVNARRWVEEARCLGILRQLFRPPSVVPLSNPKNFFSLSPSKYFQPMSRTLSPFLKKYPVFKNFLAASTVSLTGNSIFEIAMPLYVLQRTESVVQLSLVSVALHLPHFLTAPLTGFLADNYNKRRLLIGCDVGQIVMLVLVLAYHYSGVTTIWPLLLLILLNRSLQNLFETVANFQIIPGFVEPEDVVNANTWFLSFHRLIQIIGPFLGGVLMTLFGAEACILVNILSFSATLAFTYQLTDLDGLLRGKSPARVAPAFTVRNLYTSFRDNLGYVYRSPVFRPFVALMFLWNLSSLTLNSPSLTYYFNGKHGFSPAEYGFAVAAFGVLGIIGYLLSDRFYRVYPFASTFYAACLGQAVLGTIAVVLCPFPIAMAVFFSLSRMGSSVLSMGTFILRQTQVPREMAGGVNAALRMFFMSAAPISAALQGLIMDRFGVETSLALGAACLWGAVWYAAELSEHYPIHRHAPTKPPQPALGTGRSSLNPQSKTDHPDKKVG
jgi:predicted MFS family arabinose efflux permease